jgi:hypothetical protein
MNKEYNLVGIIRILLTWRKHIIAATVGISLLVLIFSFVFMDDYYKSFTTLYPINMAFNDRAAIFNTEHTEYYGGKEDVNRVMTIAESSPLADYIIAKYQLPSHYKIDTTKRAWRTKVRKEFKSNYRVIKTELNAVEISLLDIDPKLAKTMMEDIVATVDSTYRNIEMSAKRQQLATFTDQIALQQLKVDHYQDTIAYLENTFHIKQKSATDGRDIVEGDNNSAIQLYKTLTTLQKNAVNELNYRIIIKGQIENTLKNDNKCLAVIDSPTMPDGKEKPFRSIIFVTALLLSFVLSVFAALIFDQVENIRQQL